MDADTYIDTKWTQTWIRTRDMAIPNKWGHDIKYVFILGYFVVINIPFENNQNK